LQSRESAAGSWGSLAISLTFHAAVLTALLAVSLFHRPPREASLTVPVVVTVTTAPQIPSVYLDQPVQQPGGAQQTAMSGDEQWMPDAAPQMPSSISVPASGSPNPGGAVLDQPADASAHLGSGFGVTRVGSEMTDRERQMLEAERAALAAAGPKGPPTTLSVFGSGPLVGRKFIFLIDRSQSMGGSGLGVLPHAATELSSAIATLEEHHEFQVIAYHHQTVMIAQRALLPATPANKERVADFVLELASFGGTEHENAILYALTFRPDVIVVMTDGGDPPLGPSQLARIHQAADSIQIHCVQFGDRPRPAGDNFLEQLASENQGSYRYVNVNDWIPSP